MWILARAGNFGSALRSYYQVLINITMAHYTLFFIGSAKLPLNDDYHQCAYARDPNR